ncbi:hypothetical protein HC256_001983 [Beauveria bassiana]|nr:hypothetical protein HC256_001983 [Beauveria bassiana]
MTHVTQSFGVTPQASGRNLENQPRTKPGRENGQTVPTSRFFKKPQSISCQHRAFPLSNANPFKMLSQISRVARARSVMTTVSRSVQTRSFIAPTVPRRADFVQELYLKELKAYKMPPVKESDSVGQVQTFAEPKTPKSPEEADLASSLQEYESMAVEIEGQDAAQQASGIPAALPDWLEAEEEDAAPKH